MNPLAVQSHSFPTGSVVLTVLGSAAGLAVGFVGQRKFIDGTAYLRFKDRYPAWTDTWVRVGFAILPTLFMFGAGLALGVFALIYHATQVNFFGVLAVLSGVAVVPAFIWAAKEYWQPTVRRRPSWWDHYQRGGGSQ